MEQENEVKKSAPAVQTLTDDMVKVLEGDREGLVKKIIHEQEAHEVERKNTSPESKKNRFFLILSLVLLALSFSIFIYLFITNREGTVAVINPDMTFIPLIFTDKADKKEIGGLSRDKVVESIYARVANSTVKQGGIEGIYLTENEQDLGLRRFISLLKSSFVPGDTALVSDRFLMGVFNGESKDFFLLLKMRSFVDIFEAMRNWEKTMVDDLDGLFGAKAGYYVNSLAGKTFTDGYVENKNARILYDDLGQIAMMYVYADDQSVIVTNSSEAVHEVILRLSASQIRR